MSLLTKTLITAGIIKPTAFHVYWTKPKGELPFSNFEILTMVAGPINWRYQVGSKFILYVDGPGQRQLERLGVLDFYDEVLPHTVLNPRINPHTFWAAVNIDACLRTPVPFVRMDLDAYVRYPFWKKRAVADVMPAYVEPTEWECYQNPEKFAPYVNPNWPKELLATPGHNVCVLLVTNSKFRNAYCAEAEKFMARFSNAKVPPKLYTDYNTVGGSCCFEEMMFAEQRILGIVAEDGGFTIRPISKFFQQEDRMYSNHYIKHLWKRKGFLSQNADAYKEYMEDLHSDLLWVADNRHITLLEKLWERIAP